VEPDLLPINFSLRSEELDLDRLLALEKRDVVNQPLENRTLPDPLFR
jgi:hypothetical protein